MTAESFEDKIKELVENMNVEMPLIADSFMANMEHAKNTLNLYDNITGFDNDVIERIFENMEIEKPLIADSVIVGNEDIKRLNQQIDRLETELETQKRKYERKIKRERNKTIKERKQKIDRLETELETQKRKYERKIKRERNKTIKERKQKTEIIQKCCPHLDNSPAWVDDARHHK